MSYFSSDQQLSNFNPEMYANQIFNSTSRPIRRPMYLPGPMVKGDMFGGIQMLGDAFLGLGSTLGNRKLKKTLFKESLPEYYKYTVELDPNDPNEYVLDKKDLYDVMMGEGRLRTPDVYQSDVEKYSMVNFDPESGNYKFFPSSRPINQDLYPTYSDDFGEGSKSLSQIREDIMGNQQLFDLITQAQGAPEGFFPFMQPDGRMGVTEDPDYLQYYYDTMMGNYRIGGSLPKAQWSLPSWNDLTSGISDAYDAVSDFASDTYDDFVESDFNQGALDVVKYTTGADSLNELTENIVSGDFDEVERDLRNSGINTDAREILEYTTGASDIETLASNIASGDFAQVKEDFVNSELNKDASDALKYTTNYDNIEDLLSDLVSNPRELKDRFVEGELNEDLRRDFKKATGYDSIEEFIDDLINDREQVKINFINSDLNTNLSNRLEEITGFNDITNLFSNGNFIDFLDESAGEYLTGVPLSEAYQMYLDGDNEDFFESFLYDSGLVEDIKSGITTGLENFDQFSKGLRITNPELAKNLNPFNYQRSDEYDDPFEAGWEKIKSDISDQLNRVVPFYDPFDFGDPDAAILFPEYTGETFNDAFAKARRDLGANQFFLYQNPDGTISRHKTNEAMYVEGQDVQLDQILDEAPTRESGEILAGLYDSIGTENGPTQDQFNQFIRMYDELGQPELVFSADDNTIIGNISLASIMADTRTAASFSPNSPSIGVIGLNLTPEELKEDPMKAFDNIIKEMGHLISARNYGKVDQVGDLVANIVNSVGNEDMISREAARKAIESGDFADLGTDMQAKFYKEKMIGDSVSEEWRAHQILEPKAAYEIYNPFKLSDDALKDPEKYGFQSSDQIEQLVKLLKDKYFDRDFEGRGNQPGSLLNQIIKQIDVDEETLIKLFPNIKNSRAGTHNYYESSDSQRGTKEEKLDFEYGGSLPEAQVGMSLFDPNALDAGIGVSGGGAGLRSNSNSSNVTAESLASDLAEQGSIFSKAAENLIDFFKTLEIPKYYSFYEHGGSLPKAQYNLIDSDPFGSGGGGGAPFGTGAAFRGNTTLPRGYEENNEEGFFEKLGTNISNFFDTYFEYGGSLPKAQYNTPGVYTDAGVSEWKPVLIDKEASDRNAAKYNIKVIQYPYGYEGMEPGHIEAALVDDEGNYISASDETYADILKGREPYINRWNDIGNRRVTYMGDDPDVRTAIMQLSGAELENFLDQASTFSPTDNSLFGLPTAFGFQTTDGAYDFVTSNCADGICLGLGNPDGFDIYDAERKQLLTDPLAVMDLVLEDPRTVSSSGNRVTLLQGASDLMNREMGGLVEYQNFGQVNRPTFQEWFIENQVRASAMTQEEAERAYDEDTMDPTEFAEKYSGIEIDEVPMPKLEDDVTIADPTVTGKKAKFQRFLDSPGMDLFGGIGTFGVQSATALNEMFGLDKVAREAEEDRMRMTSADNAFMTSNPLFDQGIYDVNTGLTPGGYAKGFGLARLGMEVDADPEIIEALVKAGANVNYI